MKVIVFVKYVITRFPLHVTVIAVAMVIAALLEMVSLLSVAPIVDLFLHPDLNGASDLTKKVISVLETIGIPVSFGVLMGFFLSVTLLKSVAQLISVYCISWTNNSVLKRMILDTYKALFNAQWYLFASDGQGKLLNTLVREVGGITRGFLMVGTFFSDAFMLLFCLVVPLYISWLVTITGLSVAIFLAIPLLLLGKFNYRLGKAITRAANRMTSMLQESFGAAKIIIGFGAQERNRARLEPAVTDLCIAVHRSGVLRQGVPLLYIPSALTAAGCALYAAQKLSLPLSETTVLLYSLMRAVPYLSKLAQSKNTLDNLYPSFDQLQQLKQRARKLKQRSGTKIFDGFGQGLDLESVTFAYPERGIALENIDVHIRKGSVIGVVGKSGSGKTTLVDMIMGFHEPTDGCITINGEPLNNYDITSYRERIGYVPQDPTLFNLSITENLLWAYPGATAEELRQACRQANAMEFIDTLPKGMKTVIGDRGVRLSGGQCQRLALARAILRKPDLLILDEATSALDTNSERLIQKSIESIAGKTTLVVIAHRLSTIINSDHIYVLEKGRIVEEGSYEQLVAMNGRFTRMVSSQHLRSTS